MKKILPLTFLIFILQIAINAVAQPPQSIGSWQWARTIGGGGSSTLSGDETLNQSVMDSKGNIYVCGKVVGFAAENGYNNSNNYVYQNNNHQNLSAYKGFVAKYSCQGELLWYKTLGDSLGSSAFYDMLIDDDDNLYVTGASTFGYARTFWGDSLICSLTNLGIYTGMSSGLMMKINTNVGSIDWLYNTVINMGANVNWKFHYYQEFFGATSTFQFHHMDFKGDTLVYIGKIDSIPNVFFTDTSELALIYFNKNTGQYLGRKRLLKIDYNKSDMYINGFYRYRNGYLALLNVQDTNITFLGKKLNTPDASNGGIQWGIYYDAVPVLIKFNDDSLIEQQVFEDSLFTRELRVNKFTNQIDFTVESHSFETLLEKGKPFLLNSTQPAQSYFNFPRGIVHLTDINKTKYLFKVDTANVQSWISLSSIAPNGDLNIGLSVAGDIPIQGYLKFKNIELKSPIGVIGSKVAYIILGMNDTSINFYLNDIKNLDTLIDLDILNSQVNEKGEFYLTDEINFSTIIVNSDSTLYQGGGTDLLTAKFGMSCDSSISLISPILPTKVNTICTNGTIIINWQDNSHVELGYIVYRSSSANGTFQTLDTLPANTIQFIDTSAFANTSYWYKVAAYNNVDTSYNNLIDSVTTCNVGFGVIPIINNLKLYPNPAGNQLTVGSNQFLVNTIEVTNVLGQSVLAVNPPLQGGKGDVSINIEHLTKGIYFLKATDTKGNRMNGKFVKE